MRCRRSPAGRSCCRGRCARAPRSGLERNGMERTLACGESVPALGQGTWNIGDDPDMRAEEIATIREGIDLGLALVDTAEMYGDGRSEQLVGEAIRGLRDKVFLV